MLSIRQPALKARQRNSEVPVAVSRDTLEAAQLSIDLPFHNMTLRGRSQRIAVAAFNVVTLSELLATAGIT